MFAGIAIDGEGSRGTSTATGTYRFKVSEGKIVYDRLG